MYLPLVGSCGNLKQLKTDIQYHNEQREYFQITVVVLFIVNEQARFCLVRKQVYYTKSTKILHWVLRECREVDLFFGKTKSVHYF